MGNEAFIWAMDLGGTKIEGMVWDPINMRVLYRERVPTQAEHGYNHVLGQIQKLLRNLSTAVGQDASHLGLATPGSIDPKTGCLKNCNATCMNGHTLQSDLAKTLGIPVEVANDANCFALAETKYGAVSKNVPDAKVVFGVILGTGVGGGLVCHGEIWSGAHGIAGEWGHNPLAGHSNPCYCGKFGCNESVFSGPALERYYTHISGKELKMDEIGRLYTTQQEPFAIQTIEYFLENLAKSLALVVNILDPDAIVLGGGLSHLPVLYSSLHPMVASYVFNPEWKAPILPPALGDSAGIFGAAELIRLHPGLFNKN
jgi:fructokinase